MRPRVVTRQGVVEGADERGVRIFRGIPFARPPVGALRFRAPEPCAAWSGVRDCGEARSASPQPDSMPGGLARIGPIPPAGVSEDCLYLNVFAPRANAARRSALRPVMVFVHGGGFTSGAGSWGLYAGHGLARRGDVVVVTFNYRLGALGALYLARLDGADAADPNPGLRDQLAALRWVADNVEAFGGDPDNTTVFAQSAGAMSMAALLGMPDASGLFGRAILQSGAAANVHSAEVATGIARDLALRLALDPDASGLADRLRGVPVASLVAAQQRVSAEHRLPVGQIAWQPTIDGALLVDAPLERIRAGAADGVALMLGTNRDEWKMFTAFDAKRRGLDESTLVAYLERTFERDDGDPARRARRAAALYLGREDAALPTRSPGDAWMAFQTDRVFRIPAMRLAEARTRRPDAAPLFAYRFDWAPPLLRARIGACHAMELPFVFGTRPLRPLIGLSRAGLRLSSRIQNAWLAFARDGDPSHADLEDWRDWSHAPSTVQVLDAHSRVEAALPAPLRSFWAEADPPDLALPLRDSS